MAHEEDPKGYYKVLGVDRSATQIEIRHAYHTLALKCHPDKAGPSAEAAFKELSEAYTFLGDPKRREKYHRDSASDIDWGAFQGMFNANWGSFYTEFDWTSFSQTFKSESSTFREAFSRTDRWNEFCRENGYPDSYRQYTFDRMDQKLTEITSSTFGLCEDDKKAAALLKFLVEKERQDVNELGTGGYSPLWSAMIWKNPECVRMLVHQGADVNFLPDKIYYSVLDEAVLQFGEAVEQESRLLWWDVIKTLIAAGASCRSPLNLSVDQLRDILVDTQRWTPKEFDDICHEFDRSKEGDFRLTAWQTVLLFAQLERIPQIVDQDEDNASKVPANSDGKGEKQKRGKNFGVFPETVDKEAEMGSEKTRKLLTYRINHAPITDEKSYKARLGLAELFGNRFDIMAQTLRVETFREILDERGFVPERSECLLGLFVSPETDKVFLTPLDTALLFGTSETAFEMISEGRNQNISVHSEIDSNRHRAGTLALYTDCFVERMSQDIMSIKNDYKSLRAGFQVELFLDACRFEEIYVKKTVPFPTYLECVDKSVLAYAVVGLYLDKLEGEGKLILSTGRLSADQREAMTACVNTLSGLNQQLFEIKSVDGAQYENYVQQVLEKVNECLKSVKTNRCISEKLENYFSLLIYAFKHLFSFMLGEADANKKTYTANVASPSFFKSLETSKDSFVKSLKKFPVLTGLLFPAGFLAELGEERSAEEVRKIPMS